jgi:hypothetical protein
MWRRADLFDAPVYYLAFHGKPGTVISLTGGHRRRAADRGVRGLRRGYRNLVYFAACSVLRGAQGERFAKAFLSKTGVRAVIGYTTRVDWMASLVADLLFPPPVLPRPVALAEFAAYLPLGATRLSPGAAARASPHDAGLT